MYTFTLTTYLSHTYIKYLHKIHKSFVTFWFHQMERVIYMCIVFIFSPSALIYYKSGNDDGSYQIYSDDHAENVRSCWWAESF